MTIMKRGTNQIYLISVLMQLKLLLENPKKGYSLYCKHVLIKVQPVYICKTARIHISRNSKVHTLLKLYVIGFFSLPYVKFDG